jgi:hypothetical protein
VASDLITEDEVVVAGEVLAAAERVHRDHRLIRERDATPAMALGAVLLALDVVALHVHDAVGEVDVPPAQREQLTHPQAGERRRQDDGPQQHVRRLSRDGMHLLDAQDVEVVGALDGDLLRVLARVDGDPALALRAGHDAVQDHEHGRRLIGLRFQSPSERSTRDTAAVRSERVPAQPLDDVTSPRARAVVVAAAVGEVADGRHSSPAARRSSWPTIASRRSRPRPQCLPLRG